MKHFIRRMRPSPAITRAALQAGIGRYNRNPQRGFNNPIRLRLFS